MPELLKFIGVTIMALITAGTFRLVLEMCGPEGVERVREARQRQDARQAIKEADHDR